MSEKSVKPFVRIFYIYKEIIQTKDTMPPSWLYNVVLMLSKITPLLF